MIHQITATCPYCHKVTDAQGTANIADTDRTPPRAGDFTLCVYCGQFGVWTVIADRQIVRRLQRAEWDALPLKERLALTQLLIGWRLGQSQRDRQRN